MRYRPFGTSGKAVSALSLVLRESGSIPNVSAWRGLIYAALENGVNSFEMVAGSDVIAMGLGEALRAVERRLIFLSLRIEGDAHRPIGAEAISNAVKGALRQTGAGYFDTLMLNETAYENLLPEGYRMLEDIRSAGVVLQTGVTGRGPAVESCILDAAFEVLATPFSLVSDWQTRRLVKEAAHVNMAVMAYDPAPRAFLNRPEVAPQKPSLLRRPNPANPLAGSGTYAFLHTTSGWTAEELCFAYALTEPSFATVQMAADNAKHIEALAAVCDKELPTGAAAQIEMARFGAEQAQKRA